jgi:hypothetical protein
MCPPAAGGWQVANLLPICATHFYGIMVTTIIGLRNQEKFFTSIAMPNNVLSASSIGILEIDFKYMLVEYAALAVADDSSSLLSHTLDSEIDHEGQTENAE